MTCKTNLPPNGVCQCGCKELMLAKDQTEFTPVHKDSEWGHAGSYTEQLDEVDPMGSVRLFCTACGQYFNVPQELL